MKRIIVVLMFTLLYTAAASAEVKSLTCTDANKNELDVRIDQANSQASAGHQTYQRSVPPYDKWTEPNPMQHATFTDTEVTWVWMCPSCDKYGLHYTLSRTTGKFDVGVGGYSTYRTTTYQCELAQQKF